MQVVPYTECKLSVTEQKIKETRLAPQTFTERRCSKSQRKIPHQKLLPECKNVTKANCVLTNWETDTYGNQAYLIGGNCGNSTLSTRHSRIMISPQVWAGNEACEPVTWLECKLVPRDVNLGRKHSQCAGVR